MTPTTPTDAQMKLARECAATAVIEPSTRSKTDILKGYCDNWHGVQSALLAIQATEARAALGEPQKPKLTTSAAVVYTDGSQSLSSQTLGER